jgi:hypothetical protein
MGTEIESVTRPCGRALGYIRILGRRPNHPVAEARGDADWCIMV